MQKKLLLFLSLLSATVANAQLSGTYTISTNSSQNPDYSSIGAAVSALAAGVSGQVVFEVAPGTYEEYVSLNNISGTSTTNRVVFRGMGADNQQVVVTSNAGYTDNATLTLNGTDHVTFENMTMASTSTNKANVVRMKNGNEVVGMFFAGRREEAFKYVEKAFKMSPCDFCNYSQCYDKILAQARMAELSGDIPKAIELFKQARRISNNDVEVYMALRALAGNVE